MRLEELLSEDSDDDLEYYELAIKLTTLFHAHLKRDQLKKNNWYIKRWQHSSDQNPTMVLKASLCNFPTEHNDLHFVFKNLGTVRKPSGSYGRFTSGKPYIKIRCVSNVEDIQLLRTTLLFNQAVTSSLIHEFIHYSDDKYRNQVLVDPDRLIKNQWDLTRVRYYNSAEEFNAYFHNIAETLFDYISRYKNEDLDECWRNAKLYGITPNFIETLKNILGNFKSESWEGQFLKTLSNGNRRSLYKRLYRFTRYVYPL